MNLWKRMKIAEKKIKEFDRVIFGPTDLQTGISEPRYGICARVMVLEQDLRTQTERIHQILKLFGFRLERKPGGPIEIVKREGTPWERPAAGKPGIVEIVGILTNIGIMAKLSLTEKTELYASLFSAFNQPEEKP